MPHVSRPLIGLLIAAILFLGLWVVALKPSSSTPTVTPPKPAAAVKHVAAARTAPTAAKIAPAAAAKVKPAATVTKHAPAGKPAPAARPAHAATPTERVNLVDRALVQHKTLALLFYNPAASDDQAVKQELGTVPTSGGRVFKLAIPLSELANYPVVTNQVLVSSSPTLVIVDSSQQAFTLVGFSSAFEIAHRVGDALSMH